MKQGRRFGIERNIDFPECLITVEVCAYVLKRHRFMGVTEFNADKFLGLMQHVLRYSQRRGRWRRRRHGSRTRRRALRERRYDVQMGCRQRNGAQSRNKLYERAPV